MSRHQAWLTTLAGIFGVLALWWLQQPSPSEALPRPAPAAAGRFGGKFELVPLFDAGHRPVQRNGHSYYAVRNRITFLLDVDQDLVVKAGQVTDLASIPRVVWPLMPPDGPWAEAAVFHDACYRTHGQVYGGFTRAQCDEVLRRGMVALNVPTFQRVTIWGAVRLFGGAGWGH